jgi:hypothetical protein
LEDERCRHGDSKVGHTKNPPKEEKLEDECMFMDYFAPSPMYSEELFKCQYKMSYKLFMRILQAIFYYAIFFLQR